MITLVSIHVRTNKTSQLIHSVSQERKFALDELSAIKGYHVNLIVPSVGENNRAFMQLTHTDQSERKSR